MNKFNLENEWNFIIDEINHKQEHKNYLVMGELLLVIQILLNQITEIKDKNRKLFLKSMYLMSKNQYLELK